MITVEATIEIISIVPHYKRLEYGKREEYAIEDYVTIEYRVCEDDNRFKGEVDFKRVVFEKNAHDIHGLVRGRVRP